MAIIFSAAVACFGFSDGRPPFNKDCRFAHPETVLDVCGGLVVISPMPRKRTDHLEMDCRLKNRPNVSKMDPPPHKGPAISKPTVLPHK
ncbi:hypothetical protein PAXRUDRAFT_826738 [Paxillus rubicundulus Ve08.2h10]|uniref:Uncharacterized protein n=1 Tax=Paxillus rubicundulus Ve08.2h10 TaxID=930991 RepID=A0A0D0E9E7_9AGAM|nr:hypothetical protein PAXRUDRAFT_826738 [Paxillus rubicundulus Ve08.2h10]